MRLSEGCELLVTVFIAVLICLRASLLAGFLEQKKVAEKRLGLCASELRSAGILNSYRRMRRLENVRGSFFEGVFSRAAR